MLHAWSAIHHDIGYKSDFGVPREINRQFARLAGLLELADDEFVRARDNMFSYTEDIRKRIITDDADDVTINMIALNEYVLHNKKMQSLIKEIADISGAEIKPIDPENYIPQLAFLGIKKLGDIEIMIKDNYNLAVKLLTKKKGYVMQEYVNAIKNNEVAFIVKTADRLHNLQSAFITSEEFKRKYILETIDWYLDFSPEIIKAVKNLADSLSKPLSELSFLYTPIETWKL